jgi:hypothetical protein
MADLVVGGVADHRAQEVLLVDDLVHRLPDLRIVEGRVQVVEADHPEGAVDLAGLHHRHAARALEDREEVDLRRLEEVDLAIDQRLHGGLRVRHPDQLDAVDAGDLAARERARRLAARHVVGVLQVDGLAAGDPLVLGEPERSGADGLGDLGVRVDHRLLLAHHHRHRGAGLAERREDLAVGLLEDDLERLLVDRLDAVGEQQQALAGRVARAPATDRGDDVARRDGRAVVPAQPVAQRHRVGQLVGADVVLADHLRLRDEVVVDAEQRVVDQQPVDPGDGLRRPVRVEGAHVGVHHGAQDLLLRGRDGGGEGRDGRAAGKGKGAQSGSVRSRHRFSSAWSSCHRATGNG